MKTINEILETSIKIWKNLSDKEKNNLINSSRLIKYKKGDVIHKGSLTCLGLIIVSNGTIRAYLSSENGKQITLYKLLNNDICLFSASCIMKDITFDIYLECEEDTEVLLIPTDKYKEILHESTLIANYINSILTSRFSDIMWIFEQFVFHSLDKRLATYLLDQRNSDNIIIITHEKIANEIGSAREVVSRILKIFEKDNIIIQERNKITIKNENKLIEISEK